MKGLYCRVNEHDAEPQFVIQEMVLPDALSSHQVRVEVKACGLSCVDLQLLKDMKIQQDLISVGREVVGVVKQVGSKVSLFQPEEEVVGILPLDCPFSGLCGIIDIDEQYLVHKPAQLSRVTVAAALRDAVSAYTALHTLAHMAARQSVLVVDGASSFGLMCVQLAWYHGLKVLATSHSPQDHAFLEQLRPTVGAQDPLVARVIPVYKGPSELVPAVLEETGSLGVDIVIDSGVRLHEEEPELHFSPHKHDLIDVLAVGGHWVTSHLHLQLDPPDCSYLHLKSASLSFLNPEVWTTSSAQHGRYLHILKDIVDKMSSGVLRPRPEEFPMYEATVAMETLQLHPKKKAVVKLSTGD